MPIGRVPEWGQGHRVNPDTLNERGSSAINALIDHLNALAARVDSLEGRREPVKPFWAMLTAEASGGGGEYDGWKQVVRNSTSTGWADVSGGRTETTTGLSVFEVDSTPDLQVGTSDGTVGLCVPTMKGGGSLEYVFFPKTNAAVFAVNVSQTGGSNGTSTTAATWTYTATTKDGVTLGTVLSPENQRPTVGKVTAGTKGHGYFYPNGTFVLSWVNEIIGGAAECS